MSPFYRILRAIAIVVVALISPYRRVHAERIPRLSEKGLMVIANHVYWWDPILVAVTLPFQVHYMGKAEIFQRPFLRWLATALGAFPVRRGEADIGAIKHSMTLLREGRALGIFPEGTRSRTGVMGTFHEGSAMIALKTDAIIFPIHLEPYRLFRFKRTRITYGEPFSIRQAVEGVPKEAQNAYATEFIRNTINELGDSPKNQC